MRRTLALGALVYLAVVAVPAVADQVDLFDANEIFKTFSPNDFSKSSVFADTEVTLTCSEGDLATIKAPAAEGGSVIVDNYMEVNGVNVCDLGTAGPGIESPSENYNCFKAGNSSGTGPIQSAFTGIGDVQLTVGADGIIPVGTSTATFELYDWGSVAGNTSLYLDTTCYLGEPCVTDLIAGGGNDKSATDVGDVTVLDNGDGSWDVTYEATGGWEFTELHLDLGCAVADFPTTRKGNPQVGHFTYQDYPPIGTQSYTFAGVTPDDSCSCAYFAAHAVVVDTSTCDDQGLVFGIERDFDGTDDQAYLYQANVVDGSVDMIASFLDPSLANVNSPNGLAYDPLTDRLYFSIMPVAGAGADGTDGSLAFVERGSSTVVPAGGTPGHSAGATFYNGEYYYLPNATDDLLKVSFDSAGYKSAVTSVCPDITGDAGSFRFGDIVISADGSTMYGSTNGPLENFFALDLDTCTYTEICARAATSACGARLQLAWGANGVLYGQSTGDKSLYRVDPASGLRTFLGYHQADDGFTDLASGERCMPRIETAWGDGTEFVDGKSWATYFTCGDCDAAMTTGDFAAVRSLVSGIGAAGPRAARAAVRQLRRLGTHQALVALEEIAGSHPSAKVRRIAQRGVRRLRSQF